MWSLFKLFSLWCRVIRFILAAWCNKVITLCLENSKRFTWARKDCSEEGFDFLTYHHQYTAMMLKRNYQLFLMIPYNHQFTAMMPLKTLLPFYTYTFNRSDLVPEAFSLISLDFISGPWLLPNYCDGNWKSNLCFNSVKIHNTVIWKIQLLPLDQLVCNFDHSPE